MMSIIIFAASTLPALTWGYSTPMLLHGNHHHQVQVQKSPSALWAGTSPDEHHHENPNDNNDVNRDFEDLMDDLNKEETATDTDASVTKTKEVVDRYFRLFSEFNRGSVDASSEGELDENEKMLRKQQKWANKVIDLAAEFGKDFAMDDNDDAAYPWWGNRPRRQQNGLRRRSRMMDELQDNTNVVAPLYSFKDDKSVFLVELEVPGVSLDDIDINLEKETNVLAIRGQRKPIGSERPFQFSKSFMLDRSVDTDNIKAKLVNGILTVTAPKVLPKNLDTKQIHVATE